MTLMVALVGEQTLPNFLPVLHFHPDDVLLLYTKRTKPVYDRLAVTLGQKTIVHGLETDAYDIVTIVKALSAELETPALVGQSLLFNLTGGTKAMAFAAHQVAQQRQAHLLYLQSEGKKNYVYHYSLDGQQLQPFLNEELSECIELDDLLDLQFGTGKWKEAGPDLNKPGGGGLFEQALVDALRSHSEYQIMAGVKWLNEKNREVMDIDVLIRYQNQYGIMEAKVGTGGGSIDGIRQLVIASRQLGTYTHMFYAITITPTLDHEEIRKAFYIQPISLPTYGRGRVALTAEEATELTSIIANALKSS